MNGPYLRIVEQPESTTRLRYESEKKHGFLLGANSPPGAAKSDKTYPKVELMNHSNKARIEVRLCQEAPCDDLHPADEGLKARTRLVGPQRGSYVVSFENIKINLLKNNEVTNWLMKTTRKTYAQCKPLEEAINKYAVRLRFSAHHPTTGAMICPPVYSTTVKHCKEKLSVISYVNFRGSAKGGQTFWINVEGINIRKNIRVVFFEEMADGSRYEFSEASLNDSHFHHMHTIMTETPPYPHEITETKQVQFLLRDVTDPDDPRESESRPYQYYPHRVPILEGRTHSDSTSMSSSSTGYSSSTQTETHPKRHKWQTSNSLCRNCRRKLSSCAGSVVSEVVDLTSESSEEAVLDYIGYPNAMSDDTGYPNAMPDDNGYPNAMSEDTGYPNAIPDDMQPTEDPFDISAGLAHLEHLDIPIEPTTSTYEMFIKDDYQSASHQQPMTSSVDPVLGEANMLMNNNDQSDQQSFYDADMDEDNFMMEATQGEVKWVSDSAKPQKMYKKNDWINRHQIENEKSMNNNTIYVRPKSMNNNTIYVRPKSMNNNTIYKADPSQQAVQVKKVHAEAEMCKQRTQLEVHDVRVFQYDADAAGAGAGSSGEEYETAEEGDQEDQIIVSQLEVLKMKTYVK